MSDPINLIVITAFYGNVNQRLKVYYFVAWNALILCFMGFMERTRREDTHSRPSVSLHLLLNATLVEQSFLKT